jgi:hypothetical protein
MAGNYALLGGRVGAVRVAGDLRAAQAELLVAHDHLAARDRLAGDQEVDALAREPVERDDRAGAEGRRLGDGPGASVS